MLSACLLPSAVARLFLRPRGWQGSRDTSNEASFNSFNSTDSQRRPLSLFLFLPRSSFFQSREQTFKRAVSGRRLTRGPVDLFMANWKRKLRGLRGIDDPSSTVSRTQGGWILNGGLNASTFYGSPQWRIVDGQRST